ncbi:MAG: ABC transporter permease [Vicinamibacterales bacterium]
MTFLRDIRQAVRALRAVPTFAASVVLTLALALAATIGVVAIIRGVLLRPLPYRDPSGLAMIWSRWAAFDKTWVSVAEVFDYRAQARSFDEIAVWDTTDATLTGAGPAERAVAGEVTANMFHVLGVEPVVGRTFTEDEDVPDRHDTVVLGYELWQRRYGGDRSIVGQAILVDGVARTVVGVLPAGFRLPLDYRDGQPTSLFVPLGIAFTNEPDARGSHSYFAIGRLARGASAVSAAADLHAVTTRLTADGLYPEAMRFDAFAVDVRDEIFGRARPALVALAIMAVLLFAIAVANVTGLQLTRAEALRRDVAVRMAMGAAGVTLWRHRFAESLLLTSCAGVLGILGGLLACRYLPTFASAGVPRLGDVSIDAPTVAVAALVALTAALALAGVGVRLGDDGRLVDVLKTGAQGSAGVVRRRFRESMVVAQVTLACVLVVCAALALRSLWNLQRLDLGFSPDGVIVARLSLPATAYAAPPAIVQYYETLLERVRGLPGVTAAGIVRSLPLAAEIGDWGLRIEGYTPPPGQDAKGDWQVASDGYFEAMGERLVSGRVFDARDRADAPEVAIVNETMARTYWPGESPLGRRFRLGADAARPWVTVVGIVEDVRHNGLTGIVKEKFYRPHSQFANSTGFANANMTLVVRTSVPLVAMAAALRETVAAVDPDVPLARVQTMHDVLADASATPRLTGWLLGAFAAIALLMAAVGLYGILSYLVSRRMRELGIHLALGADRASLRWMVVRQGLGLGLVGTACGMAGAVAGARGMSGLLYGVPAFDPATFLVVPVLLLLVAVAASVIPARRATRVDPLTALRAE